MRYEVDELKTLPVATAEVATGREAKPSALGDGSAWIDFAGGPGTVRGVSFSTVAREKAPRGFFKDKVVVIGASAPSLHDVHPTSTTRDEVMSGPEVQANAIDTVRVAFRSSPRPAR